MMATSRLIGLGVAAAVTVVALVGLWTGDASTGLALLETVLVVLLDVVLLAFAGRPEVAP